MLDPFVGFGARTDQAHFPFQDIQKLGQFGEAKLDQTSLITILGWRVAVHIQTIHPERDFVPSATELSPECFSPIPTQHCCGKDQKRSAEDQQT